MAALKMVAGNTPSHLENLSDGFILTTEGRSEKGCHDSLYMSILIPVEVDHSFRMAFRQRPGVFLTRGKILSGDGLFRGQTASRFKIFRSLGAVDKRSWRLYGPCVMLHFLDLAFSVSGFGPLPCSVGPVLDI
jgi:hypothetical protein